MPLYSISYHPHHQPEYRISESLADIMHRRRKAHYAPHSHNCRTTHLIRRGTLTIHYPKEEMSTRETFGVGSRVDVEAGRVHEVWMGDEGCEYIIGE